MLELYQPRQSPIHEIDARVKIIFTLAFIIALTLTPSGAWPAFILFFTQSISFILISQIGIGYVHKRALLAIPFMLSAIPLIFVGPPPIISYPIGDLFAVPFSYAGFVRFISIAIKSWISVQMAILLAGTTPFTDLLKGFRNLHLPGIFVSTIELMWRYLFLMLEEVSRLLRARNSRSSKLPEGNKPGGSIIWRAKVTGGMAGSLFLRSIERSERVYAAMLSRGYTGEPYSIGIKKISTKERVLMFSMLLLVFGIFIIGQFYGA